MVLLLQVDTGMHLRRTDQLHAIVKPLRPTRCHMSDTIMRMVSGIFEQLQSAHEMRMQQSQHDDVHDGSEPMDCG